MATAVLIAAVGAGPLSGCGGYQITADSSCGDYLLQPSDARHDAAQRISAQIAGVESPGNPMWGLSLDGACGSNASMTLGQYFRHQLPR